MGLNTEIVKNLESHYKQVQELLDSDKDIADDTVFTLKYAARQKLQELHTIVEKLYRTTEKENLKVIAMLAYVYLYQGMISINVEETSLGENYLIKCLQLIEKETDKPEIIMIALHMYNLLGLASQNEPEKSREYLETCESLYLNYDRTQVPFDSADLFALERKSSEQDVWKKFEVLHTSTVYYLAQVYGCLNEKMKSAIYCHKTLKRQALEDEYDPIEWALNTATLSQVFVGKNCFKQARHYLAASSFILEKYGQELQATVDKNEKFESKLETFNHRSADVARCWAKYGLVLLQKSKTRLLDQEETAVELGDALEFTDLDLGHIEKQITCEYILTIEDARPVFFNVQKWLKKAQEYYTLENHASDYVQIVQDLSQLYSHFMFFEDNPESQAKLDKRRIDLLEDILSKINSQYYMQYCREIWCELGQIYIHILSIKTDKLKETQQRPQPQALQKINNLVSKGIMHLESFIKSVKNGDLEDMNQKISDDCEGAVLLSHFHLGILYNRYITLDQSRQLINVELSLKSYKKVFDYCNVYPEAKALIPDEIGICKEMVTLLPAKIQCLKYKK